MGDAGPRIGALEQERQASPSRSRSACLSGVRQGRTSTSTFLWTPRRDVSFDLVRLQLLINQLLGRRMDLVSYRELKPGLDDEVPQEAVAL